MKRLVSIAIIATLATMIILPLNVTSQEKKIRVKTVKMVDGEKVINDTTFTVKEGKDEHDIIKTLSWVTEDDSAGIVTIDLDIDSEYFSDDGKSVRIIKRGKDGDIMESHGGRYKYIIKSDDHKDCEHDFHILNDFEFEFDEGALEELRAKLDEQKDELHNMRIHLDDEKLFMLKELDGEKLVLMNELENIKELKELQNLEEIIELKNLHRIKEFEDIHIEIPEISYFPNHHEFYVDKYDMHHNVSDKELRSAGIKNKPNKLEVNDIDITIKKGVVGLDFSIVGTGTPKVTVFNYFGDKVFSGKPEVINGKYAIRIDLSAKQNGVYYLQVTQKNSSFTKKLKLR